MHTACMAVIIAATVALFATEAESSISTEQPLSPPVFTPPAEKERPEKQVSNQPAREEDYGDLDPTPEPGGSLPGPVPHDSGPAPGVGGSPPPPTPHVSGRSRREGKISQHNSY